MVSTRTNNFREAQGMSFLDKYFHFFQGYSGYLKSLVKSAKLRQKNRHAIMRNMVKWIYGNNQNIQEVFH